MNDHPSMRRAMITKEGQARGGDNIPVATVQHHRRDLHDVLWPSTHVRKYKADIAINLGGLSACITKTHPLALRIAADLARQVNEISALRGVLVG
jgi:hypothetical protein